MPAKGKLRSPITRNRDKIELSTIAWQRVCVDVPSNWALTAISGDDFAGSLRIERVSEFERKYAPYSIEVRWSNKYKSSLTSEQLDNQIKPLIDSARKLAKKNGDDYQPSIDNAHSANQTDRGVVREYSWKSKPAVLGRIWRCSSCGRLIIAQVYGDWSTSFTGEARSILNTLTCHNADPNWTRWALYGIDLLAPSDFGLIKQQLMTTYLELQFGKMIKSGVSDAGDKITVEQWSAANVQLKGCYIDEWIEQKSAELLSTLSVKKSESEINGHAALILNGNRVGPVYWLRDGLKAVKALKKPATHYSAIAWECPESNKVYLIQNMFSDKTSDLAMTIAQKVYCHKMDEHLDSEL
jgi:hypothetical protein